MYTTFWWYLHVCRRRFIVDFLSIFLISDRMELLFKQMLELFLNVLNCQILFFSMYDILTTASTRLLWTFHQWSITWFVAFLTLKPVFMYNLYLFSKRREIYSSFLLFCRLVVITLLLDTYKCAFKIISVTYMIVFVTHLLFLTKNKNYTILLP